MRLGAVTDEKQLKRMLLQCDKELLGSRLAEIQAVDLRVFRYPPFPSVSVCLMKLDIKRAYDLVDWPFLKFPRDICALDTHFVSRLCPIQLISMAVCCNLLQLKRA